jgi:putative transposase
MKRKRYTEEQVIAILKEHEAGASVPDLSRRHGVAESTIYRWKSTFGGMEVSEAKRLRSDAGPWITLKRVASVSADPAGSPDSAAPRPGFG